MAKEESIAGLVASMAKLEKIFQGVINSSSKLNENIKKNDELFGTSNQLKNELQNALTSPVLFKKLNEVLAKNLGGTASPQIKTNLAKASALRQQYIASRKVQQRLSTQIATLQARRPHAKNAQQLAAINQKIAAARAQYGTAISQGMKAQFAMKAALKRSQVAALSKNSKLGSISKLGMASKALGAFGIVVNASAQAVDFFTDKIKESSDIVAKYSRYSLGGLHAASLMYIRDIQRNIYSSKSLSASMFEFAKANADMKDSWKNVNVAIDKFTLALGTVGSKMGTAVGKLLDPVAKGFDKMMGQFAKMTAMEAAAATLIGGPVTAALIGLAKAAEWKTQEEELQAARDRIARRRDAIINGNVAALRPGDMGMFERDLLAIRPDVFERFQLPNKPRPKPNPNNPRMPGGNPAPGIPGQGPQGGQAVNPAINGAQNARANFNQVDLMKIGKELALVEKKIRINEGAIADLLVAIRQRKDKIAELEQNGVTPEEQAQIDKKQAQIDSYNESVNKALRTRGELERHQDNLKHEQRVLGGVAARTNDWTKPGIGFGKPVGADLMKLEMV